MLSIAILAPKGSEQFLEHPALKQMFKIIIKIISFSWDKSIDSGKMTEMDPFLPLFDWELETRLQTTTSFILEQNNPDQFYKTAFFAYNH